MAIPPTDLVTRRDKQLRVCGSRSKNGCVTCKIRRVKCDETKPECNRCTATGRKCDGYKADQAALQGWRPAPAASPAPTSTSKHHFPAASRAWDYFYHCCADQVFGGSQFEWVKLLIVRLGQREDAVCAAVLAFSATHEATLLPSRSGNGTVQLSGSFQARQGQGSCPGSGATAAYCSAVRVLSHEIDRHGRLAVPVALICCILFAALEMVRGDYDTAVRHIEHGLEIVAKEQGMQQRDGSHCLPGWSALATEGAMPALVSSFYRLAIAAFFWGKPEPLVQERIITASLRTQTRPSVVAPMADIDEARRTLAALAGSTLKFTSDASRYRVSGTATDALFRRRDQRLKHLKSWHAAFLATDMGQGRKTFKKSQTRLRMTRIVLESQLLALVVVLQASLDPNECCWDVSDNEYRSILGLCQEYVSLAATLSSPESQPRTANFTLDMEILPQLWLIGLKCRHRDYRRWGIDLLRGYSRKEGMWDSAQLCSLAIRCMEIEEAPLPPGGGSRPRECDRLWSAQMAVLETYTGLATFSYGPVEVGGRGVSWQEEMPI